MITNAFERYAPFIQEYIYRRQWTDLRDVQVEACEAILDTEKHVIVASGTASGKTEAAFFPILTLLEKNPASSIGIIYIGPLKALINDQFERLNELLEDSNIPVWSWHGDISQLAKKRVSRVAKGVLQITPESLESLLMRHPEDAKRLFGDLRFVVIDEIHALMGEDRGLQVLCLLTRLEQLAGCRPRRIGLSATLNDYEPAMQFLCAASDVGAVAVGVHGQKRKLALSVESFLLPEDDVEASVVEGEYYDYLYNHSHDKKCLIFTNSRGKAEEVISKMKEIAENRNERDVFYVHHGSISAAMRQEAEHALREQEGPTVAAATLTLELGIDIGDLDSTIQVGAPFTCSSFVQRLGRSGRRTGKSQMMFVNTYEDTEIQSIEQLPWDLIRSIAIIQLYLEERWVEPFGWKKKPYSLLVHQTLSTLMTFGELKPAELARKVLLLPAFRDTVTQDEYKELLRYMIENEYLERMENGTLIIGIKGEKIANHYTFYAVFQEEKTYTVVAKDSEVGTLTNPPDVGGVFLLGGKAWQVITLDEEKKRVHVVPSADAKVPLWCSFGGDIHKKVVERMKQVLEEDTKYVYLRSGAKTLLERARNFVRENGLVDQTMIPCGSNSFYICPWVGTKQIRTLEKLFANGLKEMLEITEVENLQYFLFVKTRLSVQEFMNRWKSSELDLEDPDVILKPDKTPYVDKYDRLIPEKLLRTAYLKNQMDLEGIKEIFP